MSSDKQMIDGADNDVVEQPGGGRELVCTADDRSQFFGRTATNDLEAMARDVALRSGAAPTDQWSVQYNNVSQMVSRGKIPPMPRPALSMILSGPTIPCAPPQNVQGQVPGPQGPRGRGQAAKQMTNSADDNVVEQPGGNRMVRALDAESSRFAASATTDDLEGTVRDIALRSGAASTDRWFIYANNTPRMMAYGLSPAPLRPPRNMFGLPTRALALPTVQGQVPGPQGPRGRGQAARRPGPRPLQGLAPRPPRGPAPQPPQRQDAQRPQQNRASGRGSRGANRGGARKSGRRGTSSSLRALGAKLKRDPEFLKEVQELAKRREQETSRAAQDAVIKRESPAPVAEADEEAKDDQRIRPL